MVYEFVPWLLLMNSKNIVIVAIERHVVLLNVVEQVVRAKDLCNLNQLIIVVLSLEEWFFLEDHSCEHATKRPNVRF